MNLVGSLVGVDRFEIVHMADHWILERNSIGAKHAAGAPSDIECNADVVELAHRDVGGVNRPFILLSAQVQRQQHAPIDSDHHLSQLSLNELEGSDGLAKHAAFLGVVECSLVAGTCRTQGAKHDSESSLAEARKRSF